MEFFTRWVWKGWVGKESRAQKIFGELLSDGEGKGVRAAPLGLAHQKVGSALWPQNVPKYQQHPGLRFEVPLGDSDQLTGLLPDSASRRAFGIPSRIQDEKPHALSSSWHTYVDFACNLLGMCSDFGSLEFMHWPSVNSTEYIPKRAALVPRSDRSATSSLGAFSRSEGLSCGHLPSSLAYPQCPCRLECDYTKQRAAQIDSKAAWRRCAPPCTCVDVHLRPHSLSVWWAHLTPQRSRVLRITTRKVDSAHAHETRGALVAARHMPDASPFSPFAWHGSIRTVLFARRLIYKQPGHGISHALRSRVRDLAAPAWPQTALSLFPLLIVPFLIGFQNQPVWPNGIANQWRNKDFCQS